MRRDTGRRPLSVETLVMRLLNLPVPIFTAAIIQQVEPVNVTGPGWVVALATGAFVVLWFLNAIGKLPGGGSERREASFKDTDRGQLNEIHGIVTAEDVARPRWPRVWAPLQETLEIRDLVAELADLRQAWEAERAEWKVERARMEHRITELEDVVRRQEHALKYGAGGAA